MRGRGRGNNRDSQKPSRGSTSNPNAARNSTRNWDRAPPAGSSTATADAKTSTVANKKGTKPDGRLDLQWLPSVSRSSGLEPHGDALRSFETQEEYWKYIIEKILDLELPNREPSKIMADRQEKEANVMILLRKLREGFVSTNRRDDFAIQASSFGYLLDTYPSSSPSKKPDSTPNQRVISLLHFLHTLLDEYPSQRTSHRLILPSSSTHLFTGCPEWSIASEISSALRRNNWWTLDKLTRPELFHERLTHVPWTIPKSDQDWNQNQVFDALPQRALSHLLHELRGKIRGSAWPVLRAAYREVGDSPWLECSLMLGPKKEGAAASELTEFMRLGVEKGEAAVKDGSGARVWVLRRSM
ncbi:hypothetical protein FRC06_006555 [Ceratobasidium sp. 370]|nr:hypothetical protein FRC06_006555 [Ceratobasidium sp. 370]